MEKPGRSTLGQRQGHPIAERDRKSDRKARRMKGYLWHKPMLAKKLPRAFMWGSMLSLPSQSE